MSIPRRYVNLWRALLIILVGCLSACVPPSQYDNQKTIFVAANKVNCVNGETGDCLLIKESPDDEWTIFYGSIDGFEYQPGIEYELLIQSKVVGEPGNGGPMLKFELVKILRNLPVQENGTGSSQRVVDPYDLNWQKLKNLTFTLTGMEGEEIRLVDGKASGLPDGFEASLSPFRVYGDLNGDGRADAALILVLETGNGEPTHHLLAAINDRGFPQVLQPFELGQAVFIHRMDIDNGSIHIILDEYAPDDPVCCPSIQRQLSFSTGTGRLQLESEQVSETAANPSQFNAEKERIDLQSDENEILIKDAIQFNGSDHYMLRGLAGQILSVDIASPHDTVLLSILGEEYGEVLSSVESERTAWSGELPNTQDYSIRAVSVGGETEYQLAIKIRGRGGRTSMIPPEPYFIPQAEGSVEVRAGPGLGYKVIGQLDKGEAIHITGKNLGVTEETRWWRACCFDGGEGWIRDDGGEAVGVTEGLPVPEISSLGTPEPISPESASILNTGQVLYFTFESDPSGAGSIPGILEALEANQAWAAFFTTGNQALEYKQILEEYGDARQTLGSRTSRYYTLSPAGRSEFFEEAEAAALIVDGGSGRCLQPPYSALDSYTRASAAEKGFQVVLWDINSQDLKIDDPAQIAEQLKASIFPGAVVLMHDLQGESSPTAAALEILLPQLAEEGYRFVTVCE
ncbi:MAG: DUF4377 domain-containing protein [Anaerolineales bacterium]